MSIDRIFNEDVTCSIDSNMKRLLSYSFCVILNGECTKPHKIYLFIKSSFEIIDLHFQLNYLFPKSLHRSASFVNTEFPLGYAGFNCDILLYTIAKARQSVCVAIILHYSLLGYLCFIYTYTNVLRKTNCMQSGNYGKTHCIILTHWTLGMWLWVQMSQHWFRWWIGAIKNQAITWANFGSNVYRHMASLGHHQLKQCRVREY